MSVAIVGFELYTIDLPFRRAIRHAAKERRRSESIFLKCITDTGVHGFGESLPREYVTGESREETFDFLKEHVLPRLLNLRFTSMAEVISFLESCDGHPPREWFRISQPRTAAWCAVDLALLDTFGRVFNKPVALTPDAQFPGDLRFSGVLPGENGWRSMKTLLMIRAYGIRQVKVKVGQENQIRPVRRARRVLGRRCEIRVDANMSWSVETALKVMEGLSKLGVRSFEQPLPASDLAGASRLVRETGLGIMADESFHDKGSLERLIDQKACTAVNVRLSKCGGLVAAYARCREAQRAGLGVQVGCHVGETSLLSAAQLTLLEAFHPVRHVEGAFGGLILEREPVLPLLRFGYGGRPPPRPKGPGLGVRPQETLLKSAAVRAGGIGETEDLRGRSERWPS